MGEPRHLHPGTIIIGMIKQAPQQFFAIAAGIAAFSKAGLGKGLFYAAILVVVILGFRALAWWRFTYTVSPDELLIESGVISRNRRSIPWDRVQDVDIERDLFARIFGWAKVKLETGGAGKDEGSLDSIAIKDAEALRHLVRSRRSGALAAAPLADDTAAVTPAFVMPFRRLIQAGFLNFSLVWMAVLYAIFESVKDWLPFKGKDLERWMGANGGDLFNPTAIAFAIGAFILLGMVSGIVQMIVTNFDFRLGVDGNGLRRARGLFTRSEIVIPRKRIQLAMVTRRWLARQFGFAHVAVQTLGTGHGKTGGTQDLAPLANPAEAAEMLALAGDFAEPASRDFQPVAPAHAWLEVVTNTLLVAIIVLVAVWFSTAALWGLWLLPLIATLSYAAHRPHGWTKADPLLAIRRGWFAQKMALLPVRNIQSLHIERGPLQRALGLATLSIDTAGGSFLGLRITNLPHQTARDLARDLRARG